MSETEEKHAQWLRWVHEERGVSEPCPKCAGFGVRVYSSTATWRGGIGGQSLTMGVCDGCWGTGDTHRHGMDLRKMTAERAQWERDQCMDYFARSIGATLSITKTHMRVIAEILEHEERRRKTPIGVDAFWWRQTLHMVAAAMRRFAGDGKGGGA